MTFGMEFLFFVLGAATCLGVQLVIKHAPKGSGKALFLGLGACAVFLAAFTLAWSISSLIEGEIQAAGLGMVFFGLPALICGLVCRRLVAARAQA